MTTPNQWYIHTFTHTHTHFETTTFLSFLTCVSVLIKIKGIPQSFILEQFDGIAYPRSDRIKMVTKLTDIFLKIYVSLRLRVQNAVPAQPCVGNLGISLVLLNFLHCNFRLWFETP